MKKPAIAKPVSATPPAAMDAAVAGHGLHPLFQPIVSLPDGATTGYEALARWTGLGEATPEAVLNHAAASGQQTQLDHACIHAAIAAALSAGVKPATMIFINCEPTTLHLDPRQDALLARGAENLNLVFELTERSLLAHPPALLRKVAALRSDGFAIALDDVGAHLDSLALLDVISPDVIKLDLALVQSRPHYERALTWAATFAHHERTGAVVLAEGIETTEHLHRALSLGASLGQGYLFGRPRPLDANHPTHPGWSLPVRTPPPNLDAAQTSFDAIMGTVSTRTERHDTVLALSRNIEQQAREATDPPMVLTALQHAKFFTGPTRGMYHQLAATSPLVAVFGRDMPSDLGAGVQGVNIDAGDPLSSHWILLTLGANTATALICREHRDRNLPYCREADRHFEVAITHDRVLISNAARDLLSRIPE